MPDLRGYGTHEADSVLRESGLRGQIVQTVNIETEDSREHNKVVIRDQDRRPGSLVPRSPVAEQRLTAQRYYHTPRVVVGNYVGRSKEEVETMLRQARLAGTIVETVVRPTRDTHQASRTVITGQSISPGTQVKVGTQIRVTAIRYRYEVTPIDGNTTHTISGRDETHVPLEGGTHALPMEQGSRMNLGGGIF